MYYIINCHLFKTQTSIFSYLHILGNGLKLFLCQMLKGSVQFRLLEIIFFVIRIVAYNLNKYNQCINAYSNPILRGHGAQSPVVFCPFLKKKLSYDPFFKLSRTFCCGCPYEIFFQKFLFIPTHSTFGTTSTKVIQIFFFFIKKNLLTTPT